MISAAERRKRIVGERGAVGRICFGLSRNASYAAAGRGDFPTIKVGRLLKVPTAALRRQLGLEVA